MDGYTRDSRRIIYDVKCETETGEIFIVEMQNGEQSFFERRIMYYMARSIASQGLLSPSDKRKTAKGQTVKREKWSYDIKRVVGVFLMNYIVTDERHKVSRNCIVDVSTQEISSDLFEYWKIQLPFYSGDVLKPEDCKTDLDCWLYNIINMKTMNKVMPFTNRSAGLSRLSQIASFHNMSLADQELYLKEYDTEVVYRDVQKTAAAKNRAEGRAEGEHSKAISIATNMIKHGDDIDYIISVTGLTREEVAGIKC